MAENNPRPTFFESVGGMLCAIIAVLSFVDTGGAVMREMDNSYPPWLVLLVALAAAMGVMSAVLTTFKLIAQKWGKGR